LPTLLHPPSDGSDSDKQRSPEPQSLSCVHDTPCTPELMVEHDADAATTRTANEDLLSTKGRLPHATGDVDVGSPGVGKAPGVRENAAMLSRPNILIGTPCYGGLVTHVYVHSLLKLMAYATARDIGLGLWTAAHDSLITRSRNSILTTFLDDPSATHLMFIDADTAFAPEHFDRLLSFNEDLVAAMYPVKNIDWSMAARRAATESLTVEQLREAGLHYVGVPCVGTEREERDGFVTGQYAGTGFMLMRRIVAERLIAAYPETKYRLTQTYPRPARESDQQYNLFECMIDPQTGAYLSEDFSLCHRWRRIGGKVWLDTRSRLMHVGSYEFEGTPHTRLGS
jgi:hypothetical protein